MYVCVFVVVFYKKQEQSGIPVLSIDKFRLPIALCTDLSRITTELWEIPAFSPADGALVLHIT